MQINSNIVEDGNSITIWILYMWLTIRKWWFAITYFAIYLFICSDCIYDEKVSKVNNKALEAEWLTFLILVYHDNVKSPTPGDQGDKITLMKSASFSMISFVFNSMWLNGVITYVF